MAEFSEEKKSNGEEGNRRQVQGWMSLLWFERPGSDIAFSRGSGCVGQPPKDEQAPQNATPDANDQVHPKDSEPKP